MKKRLLAAILIFTVALAVTGCGSKKLDNAQAHDIIVSEVEIILGTDTDQANALSKAIADGLQVEVTGIDKSDSGYTAHCTISNHDIAQALSEFENDESFADPETFNTEIAKAFLNAPVITGDYDISIISDGEGYEAQLTEEQFDAASGGLVKLMGEWGEGQ